MSFLTWPTEVCELGNTKGRGVVTLFSAPTLLRKQSLCHFCLLDPSSSFALIIIALLSKLHTTTQEGFRTHGSTNSLLMHKYCKHCNAKVRILYYACCSRVSTVHEFTSTRLVQTGKQIGWLFSISSRFQFLWSGSRSTSGSGYCDQNEKSTDWPEPKTQTFPET